MQGDSQLSIEEYLRMPWTVRVSRNEEDGYLVARVVELPDVIATGVDEKELEGAFRDSLRASIECYLHFGDAVPTPNPSSMPVSRSGHARIGTACGTPPALTALSGIVQEKDFTAT